MRENCKGKTIDIISMEEYLKKRQAIKEQKTRPGALKPEEPANALKLAEILYV